MCNFRYSGGEMINTSKADETLQDWFQTLFDKLNRVNNIHIVWLVLLNGVLISLTTTGYLGDESIDPFSMVGGLYALNFLQLMLFAASKFNPTIQYLGKLLVAGLMGYASFWQIMSSIYPSLGFSPFIPPSQTFGLFFFFACAIGAFIYAFSGHTEYVDPSDMGISMYELEKMREAMALMEQLPPDIINQYSSYS